MGFYIETQSNQDKDLQMVEHGAWPTYSQRERRNPTYDEVPEEYTLLCVVRNGPFDVVAICYNEGEFRDFNDPSDSRPKTWMLISTEKARELCPKYDTYLKEAIK